MAVGRVKAGKAAVPAAAAAAPHPPPPAGLDQRCSNALYRLGRRVPRRAWKLLEYGGDGLLWLPVATAAALAPSLGPAPRAVALNLLLGLLLDLVLVGGAKAAVRRARPAYNEQQDFVVVVAVDRFSFPSGHSARVSFIAAFVAGLAGVPPELAAAAAAWALATALSRAAMGRHYLGDVLAGLLLGLVTAAVVTRGTYSEAGFWLDQQAVLRLDSWTGGALQRWRGALLPSR